MEQCHVCGNHELREELIDEIFQIEGRPVLVEKIPARVCTRCGEPVFSRQTTEHIRRILHGEARPIRTVPLDVFAYL